MTDQKPLPADIDAIIGKLAEQTLAARDDGDFESVMRLNGQSWLALVEVQPPTVRWLGYTGRDQLINGALGPHSCLIRASRPHALR